MYKILHVCKSKIYAGAEAVAVQIIKSLSDNYEIAYCCPDGPIKEKLNREGISYYVVNNLNYIELRKVLACFNPDIIHAHDFTASLLCSLFSNQYKVISHIHHNSNWIKYWNIKSVLYKGVLNRFSKILLVSREVKKDAIFFNEFNKNVEVIGNPVDVKKISIMANTAMNNERYDILFVGRLVNEKDPIRFIDIINMVYKTDSNIKVAMIGDGKLYAKCEKKIEKMGLGNNIKLLGFQENPYGLMKQCRLLCITSKREGFGLVASEAKALATPILLPPVGGLVELFEIGAEEYCRSDEEFAEKIKLLLNNCNYEIWKERAKQNSLTIDNIESYMNTMENVYKEIVL